MVIKSSLGEEHFIIHDLVITFQSHAMQEIDNIIISLGIRKKMEPPAGLLPLTFESLPFSMLWSVNYITAQMKAINALITRYC